MSIITVDGVSVASDVSPISVEHTNAANAKSTVKFVDFKAINVDYNRNPRLESIYSADKIGWLGRSIFDNGLLDPIVVSKRVDGSVWVVKGHLRYSAIKIVRTEGLPEVKKSGDAPAKPAVPPAPDFMDKIRCIVLEGLSPTDEIDLLMDHGTVTKLDRRENYRAIKTMKKWNFTQQLMADKIRMSRAAVSKFVWVASMPQCVEDAFMKDGKDDAKLNDITIGKLYTAYEDDKKDGTRPGEAGPKFMAEWETFVKTGKTVRVNPMTLDALVSMAENFKDADLTDLLLAIGKSDSQSASQAIERLMLRMVPVGCLPIHRELAEPVTFISEGIAETVNV